jgi:drug/metabolite transporter (DMT)-like permease
MQANPSPAATLYALGAIASWALLAALGVALQHVPPFLLTGIALVVGSIPTWPLVARHPALWRIPLPTLALGVAGLFGFHFLLFLALRTAPPVQANLVNYLWPLFIVVLAPVLLPGMGLRPIHVFAAMLGFAGAAVAILGRSTQLDGAWSWGYLLALGSALIWACYSLLTRRVPPFPTVAVGLFGLAPLGTAFLLWDKALKLGDPRQIGILSYLTPLSSTAVLMLTGAGPFSWSIALAAAMIISAAILGTRAR